MIQFKGNIFIIGCGAVAQCTLDLLFKNFDISPTQVCIIDPVDNSAAIAAYIRQGLTFHVTTFDKNNFHTILVKHLKAGDICLDLANRVGTYDVLKWCQYNSVLYLNTCLNEWPKTGMSVHQLYESIQELKANQSNKTSAIISIGANPGLISAFTKQALLDFGQYSINAKVSHHKEIEHTINSNDFPGLAALLEIKAIHITEKDTQTIKNHVDPKKEFINTWSPVEFIHECVSTTQFAWGTSETMHPANTQIIDGNIFFKTLGMNTYVKSYVPEEDYVGMAIPHDETYTIADYLSIQRKNQEGITLTVQTLEQLAQKNTDPLYIYRPTVVFVYDPCDAAKQSLDQLRKNNYIPPEKKRVIKKEIIDGADRLGCLLISPHGYWWTGSILSIEQTNKLAPGHNATVMQVAAGVIGGLELMITNPNFVIRFPEYVDHATLLKAAKPYLGTFKSYAIKKNKEDSYTFMKHILELTPHPA